MGSNITRYPSTIVGKEYVARKRESAKEEFINCVEQRSAKHASSSHTMHTSRVRNKKVQRSLFIGTKNRVCEICERGEKVIKCGGPGNHFVHIDCLNKIAESEGRNGENSEIKRRKVIRKDNKDSSESANTEMLTEIKCPICLEGNSLPCFVCKKRDRRSIYCKKGHCGKVYHMECLKALPQTSWTYGQSHHNSGNSNGGEEEEMLACPQHTCHTCASDNPVVLKESFTKDRLVRCLRCPAAYHYNDYCIPAGSEILSRSQVICPNHYVPMKRGTHHVNATWCFICGSNRGDSLISCNLCPISCHADCGKISPPDGKYICEDCETGRFPLYGEIVWAKFGVHRWWPAEILFPAQVPSNIMNLPHTRGEFAVRFFGDHNYNWVNRGRVYVYKEEDSCKLFTKKSPLFLKAISEANAAKKLFLVGKAAREAGLKPPKYMHLKTNKMFGNVRSIKVRAYNMTPCECDPNLPNPCARDSDCLNRNFRMECSPLICSAGEKCENRLFEKRQYPPLMPYKTEHRGWGLKTLVPVRQGDFLIEYVGEIINEAEYQKRLSWMHGNKHGNYYFLILGKHRILDAFVHGNVARFINHSCQPNCEIQKWIVKNNTSAGVFALCDIPAGTELVFNYNLDLLGKNKTPCLCDSPNCSGFIGLKVNKM